MKMKAGDQSAEMPEFVEHHLVRASAWSGDFRTDPSAFAISLYQVSMEEMNREKEKSPELRGRPTMFAVGRGEKASFFYVWPAPDKEYTIEVGYCPALKVW